MPRANQVMFSALALCCAAPAVAQSPAREPTDVYIRRLAGLPAESANGQIQIIDVGHDPMSTMLSIVGNRTDKGWAVSYACAASPHCAPGADHTVKSYTLSPSTSAELDRLIETLKQGGRAGRPAAIGNARWRAACRPYRLSGLHARLPARRLLGKDAGSTRAVDGSARDSS